MAKFNPIESLSKMQFVPATVEKSNGQLTEVCYIKSGDKEITLTGKDAVIANRLQFFDEVSSQSGKALAVYLAYFNEKISANYGFSGVNPMLKAIAKKLDTNTISKYRKVGLLFGHISKDCVPQWKGEIPQGVSVTNLTSVLGLASQGKKLEELTPEEINTLYKEFVDTYLDEDEPKLHLQATLSKLRQEVHDIQTTVGDGATKSKSKGKGKGKDENTVPELSPLEKASLALDNLFEFFAGDEEALSILDTLAGKLPPIEAPEDIPEEEFENLGTSTEEATEVATEEA